MSEARYTYEYPRPMLTVDSVVFGILGAHLHVLLVRRKNDPFADAWALPGGFVEMDEPLEEAAARELEEETGVGGIMLEQFHAFGDPGRDPRGRSVTVAYLALIDAARFNLKPNDDASAVGWFPVMSLPELAFDHAHIVDRAWDYLGIAIRHIGVGAQCLAEPFTMEALRDVYEAILAGPLNAAKFEAAVDSLKIIERVGEDEGAVWLRFVPGRVAAF